MGQQWYSHRWRTCQACTSGWVKQEAKTLGGGSGEGSFKERSKLRWAGQCVPSQPPIPPFENSVLRPASEGLGEPEADPSWSGWTN